MNIAKKNIDFGLALCAAKKGLRIARAGWNGKDMFVFQRPADALDVSTIIDAVKSLPASVKEYYATEYPLYPVADQPYSPGIRQSVRIEFGAYLCLKAADNSIVNGWQPSQTDMLASDWLVLD